MMLQPDEGSDDEAAADDGGHTEDVGPSVCFLISINSFGFAYSLVVATLGVVILPSEAIRLFADNHAMMLGVMLGCTGVTQLIGPAVGYYSDRSTSRYGRRRPLLVVGAVIACCGSLAMLVAHEYKLKYFFIASLTSAIAGLNMSYACYTALLPDLVPSSHLGRASGTMATMSMLGALLGFSLFGFLLQTGASTRECARVCESVRECACLCVCGRDCVRVCVCVRGGLCGRMCAGVLPGAPLPRSLARSSSLAPPRSLAPPPHGTPAACPVLTGRAART